MSKLKKYSFEGKEIGDSELAEEICNTLYKPFVVKNIVVAYQTALRQGTHKTKGRSEIAGSTKKLYKQKGTGNARVGSKKSPIRRGGGTVFGPVVREYSHKINKREKILALKSIIAQLVRENRLSVIDSLVLDSGKTKDYFNVLKNWGDKKILLVDSSIDAKLFLGTRNLKQVKTIHSRFLNVFDLMNFNKILITESALKDVESLILK